MEKELLLVLQVTSKHISTVILLRGWDWRTVSIPLYRLSSERLQLCLQIDHLLLQRKYVCDTAIYWITEPGLRLVWHGDCSLAAVTCREMREDLWGIACPKDLMDGSKVCSPLLMGEVWGEYTAIDTLPAQKLARSTGNEWRRTEAIEPSGKVPKIFPVFFGSSSCDSYRWWSWSSQRTTFGFLPL